MIRADGPALWRELTSFLEPESVASYVGGGSNGVDRAVGWLVLTLGVALMGVIGCRSDSVVAEPASATNSVVPSPGSAATAAVPLATPPKVGPDVVSTALPPGPPLTPQRMTLRVVATYPHDRNSYTQGLVWDAGRLFESSGQYGASSLREVDLESGQVLRRVDLPPELFGEGLALVRGAGLSAAGELVQLTWREGLALRWNPDDFTPRGQTAVSGEGWGLCFDGQDLVMSDGSDRLTFRDPQSLAVRRQLAVTASGRALHHLNELECVDDGIWANVWMTDDLVRIDPASGAVEVIVDAAGLLSPLERGTAEVLNGIAWVPERQQMLVTGKLWPKLFAVELR